MAYHPILYKLLGVPDGGTEPSAYVLLGVSPQQCTPETVEARLQDCRKRLRQNIPGPQFIPLVTLWEKELSAAAATLSNPRKRETYNGSITQQAQQRQAQGVPARRPEQGAAVREAIDDVVNPDGTLDEIQRPMLANRLRALRVPEPHVQSSLADLPRPAAPMRGPARGAPYFFARAVDLSLSQGLLLERDEAALLALAGKLALSPDLATKTIEEGLLRRGARRAGLRPVAPPPQTPEAGQGPVAGASPGLSGAPPFPPPQNMPPMPVDEEQVLQSILAENVPPARRDRFRVWYFLIPVGVLLLFAGGALIFVIGWPQTQTPDGDPSAVTGTDRPVVTSTDVSAAASKLYAAMQTAADSPSDLADVATRAKTDDLRQALVLAARTLADVDKPDESGRASTLYKNLLGPASLHAPQQDAAVQSLIDAARQLKTVGSQYRVFRLLWQALWLNPNPPIISGPQDAARMVTLCDKTWQESLKQDPDDPLHDPVRLSAALGKGGDLRLLAAYANERQFDPVADELVKQVLGPAKPESAQSLQHLLTVAMMSDRPPNPPTDSASRKTRLSLCDILRRTDNSTTALRIRLVLLRSLGRDPMDAAFAGDMTVASERRELADRLMGMVVIASPGSVRPITPVATTTSSPVTTPTASSVIGPVVSGPRAADIRGSFAVAAGSDAVLADAVLCLVACQDRAAALTGNAAARPGEDLASLVAAADRPAALTRSVTLSLGSVVAPSPGSPAATPSAAPTVAALKKDLDSLVPATRYKAVQALHDAGTDEATAALVAALNKTVTGSGSSDPHLAYRILDTLKSSISPSVATALVDGLGTCQSPAVAYHMVRTLEATTGLTASGDGRLTLVNQLAARKAAAGWWKSQLSMGSVRPISPIRPSYPGTTSPSKHAPLSPPVAAPWKPDGTILRLLGAANASASATGAALRNFRWSGGPAAASGGPSGATAGPEVADELARSLAAVVGQLDRMVRDHPGAKTRTARADQVLQRRQARLLASDTPLQQAAVELDAMASILELLIEEEDGGGKFKAEVDRMATERRSALAAAPSVFHEIREAACSSLALWDTLLAARAGKAGP
jgi:hypothetical protein